MKRLNSLQQWFVRLILQVGPGAPLAALTWDMGLMDMGLRVWREKILLILHLRSLDEEALAARVYREQVANNWPGLAREGKSICEKLGIEDVNETNMGKKEFMEKVTKACQSKDEEMLKKYAEDKKKCYRMKEEKYGRKEYIQRHKINKIWPPTICWKF